MFWDLIIDPASARLPLSPEGLMAAAGRFSNIASPALAKCLLADAEARLGQALIDADAARNSLLLNRFNRRQQLRWLDVISRAGIETVCLKGFAAAHTIYPYPDARCTGDLDLLVRRDDLDRLVAILSAQGFSFQGGQGPSWGSISDASFAPFVSSDGTCNIDIHIHPDSYPTHRALTAEAVFDGSLAVEADGVEFRTPLREHAFILAATNAAKDKFGAFGLLKVVDGLRLAGAEGAIDWMVVEEIARRGRFLTPMRVFVSLLAGLGASARVPPTLCLDATGVRAAEFRRVLEAYREIRFEPMGALALFRREAVLCAGFDALIRNNWRRLCGLAGGRAGLSTVSPAPERPAASAP